MHKAAAGPPLAADSRRLALGFEAWGAALAAEGADPAAARARAWGEAAEGRRLLEAIFGNSPFLSGLATRECRFLGGVTAEDAERFFAETAAAVESRGNSGEDTPALMRRLRIARRRVALLTAVADLAGWWSLEQQTAALSRFAEAALGAALRHLLRETAKAGGVKLADADHPERDSGLIVLGMGKLGGIELNYSSDIDLILLYDPDRARVTAREGTGRFFARLARDLVRLLQERTGDGYVFRTDLRLRPDPASTPPVMSVAAALTYYESVGQNWERAALIKARPVAGDRAAGAAFLDELAPFIWRKNLDFAAIQDIHSIKRQINAYRGGAHIAVAGHDIKTGRGGIREIEFFAQTQQLIWGGRRRELRVGATCEALHRLAEAGLVDGETAAMLIDDYRFLRRLEHRLQMVEDAQTHTLPADPEDLARIAVFCGYPHTDAFIAELTAHLSSVERHYAELFEQAPSLADPGNLVFTGTGDDPETLATLSRLGFAEPARVAEMVRGWHHGRMRATRSQRAREILTELVPELLRIFGRTPHPDAALLRFDRFLSRLSAGVQLFSLFYAHPGLLGVVADVMAGAPRLAELLAQRPALLDSALAQGFFSPPPDRAGLAVDLESLLAGIGDFVDCLDVLRRWAGERRFQIGVQLLGGTLDGAASGAALADIAETAIAALLPRVEAEFSRQHGRVPGGAFAVLAMGRLGSREMNLASDLDLILIYDAPPGNGATGEGVSDGVRPLAASAYYARLSQRLIGAVTAPTGEGMLWEVDMRLRPSGASGPIASDLAGFAAYQRNSAWTWEHMALTRARPVAGDPELRGRVAAVIDGILQVPRDPARLAGDVAEMRRRIAAEHPRPAALDLKYRRGGLIDLEFIVQYLLLRDAAGSPDILRRNTGEALESLGRAGALPAEAMAELAPALRLLKNLQALLSLFGDRAYAEGGLAPADATILARAAGTVDFAHLCADIDAAAAQVICWYERLVEAPAPRAAAAATGEDP